MVTKVITTGCEVECIKGRAHDNTKPGERYILDRQSIWIDCDGDAYGNIYNIINKTFVSQVMISRFMTVKNLDEVEIQNIYAKEGDINSNTKKTITAMKVECVVRNNLIGTLRGNLYYIDLHTISIANGITYGHIYTDFGKYLGHGELADFITLIQCENFEINKED